MAAFTRKYVGDVKFKASVDPWHLAYPLYSYQEQGPRVLVVLDHVPRYDLQNNQLLSGDNRTVFENILTYLTKERKLDWSKMLVTAYPFASTRNLPVQKLSKVRKQPRDRLKEIIRKFKPDRIMLMGPELIRSLLPSQLNQVDATRLCGVVRKLWGIEATGTIGLSSLANDFDDSPKALSIWPNLIGFAVNHFNYLLMDKKDRFTIDVSNYKCKIINTEEKFAKFYRKLIKAKRVAIDTETDNLTKFSNRLLTIQFAFDGETAYVLPWQHPESPFKPKQLEAFKCKLVDYFERGKSRYHIFTYAQFDITQLRQQLGFRHYNHLVWDVQGGIFTLDENRKFLRQALRLKNDDEQWFPGFALGQLALERGCNVYYEDLAVSKGDRDKLAQVPLKDVAKYGGYDVVIPFQLHASYKAEAKYRGKQYDKFETVVTHQIGAMILEFIEMEINGLNCDVSYMLAQFKSDSPLEKYIAKLERRINRQKSVKKVEKILRQEKSVPEQGLFGEGEQLFNINDTQSQQLLFFDVLGLEILTERADGKGGKVDKAFQNRYKDIKEVKLFTQYVKAKKLRDSFVKGFYRILQNNPDSLVSHRLHPHFLYFTIITGRSGAEKPSLQQVPAHGEMAGIIKRMFVPPEKQIIVKADYMAHEIRNWAIIAGDDVLEAAFKVGMNTRQAYRLLKVIDDEIRKEWEPRFKAADIHRVNYGHFYQIKPETVDPKQRQSIKGVVFGVLYGKQALNLSKDIGATVEEAQALIDLLFTKFKIGGDWVKNTISQGRRKGYIVGPQGRVRHLWGYLHHHRSVHGKMDRRSPNSMIQGFSSDQGYVGGREFAQMVWDYYEKHGQPFSMRSCNKVHDSSESMVDIIELPLGCYLLEHSYTTKVRERYRKTFDFDLGFDLELEIGFGGSLNNITEWDYSLQGQLDIVEKSIDWMKDELGHDLNKRRLMRRTEHNARIIHGIRRKELKRNNGRMLINEGNARDLGLKFACKAA